MKLRSTALLLMIVCAAHTAHATPLGNLRTWHADAAQQWELVTESGAHIRVSLPRADVLRIWAAPGKDFMGPGDKAAAIVVGEAAPNVQHSVREEPDHILIQTAALSLRIDRKPLRFTLYRAGETVPLWREVQPLELSAKHSVQVLSSDKTERFFGGGQQNGRFEFKGRQLDVSYSGGWEEGDRPSPAPFLMSSRGWGMLRNTWSDGSYDLRDSAQVSLDHAENRFDAYYFVGKDVRDVLARYTEWTGRARLLPRWAFEYGDADCYNDGDNGKKPGTVPKGWTDGPSGKTADVIESVARKYREYDMPGGWILPNDGYGCGYAALPEVVQGLSQYGFRTGLWTENGVDKIAWEVGKAGSRVQKLDVAWTGKGYQFSLDANKSAYDGILNNSDSRPFLWTVMGWAGTQRYAVAWTGDQSASWDYIRWHIPTLIGSGLSGQAYATGDVDAIFGGSPETYTRDLQWKAFTPVLMGMSGWSAAERKHPWWFDEPYRSINRRYLKLKMRLTPYMYGLSREAEQTGAPLVRGLMWDNAGDPAAWTEAYKYQFLLGRDLLVAPVYRSQAVSQGWRKGIHLPQGRWFDYWDGRQATAGAAGRDLDEQVTLDKLPVFVRAGSILPMYPEMLYDGEKPKDQLTLDLYPEADSEYTLYEDDGNTRQYQNGAFSTQKIAMHAGAGTDAVRVDIAPVAGSYAGQEARRSYAVRMLIAQQPSTVTLMTAAGGVATTLTAHANRAAYDAAAEGWFYDAAERKGTLHAKTAKQDIRQPLAITVLAAANGPLLARADDEFPAAPALGRALPADAMVVVNRPAEEPGHALENAFDGKPETWFRTVRSQAVRSGAHEWVIGFTERRLVDGIELAPRNDQHWKSGQVRDYEIYIADSNGEWGAPIQHGTLKLQEGLQTISFAPTAGRLLRFRVLSTQNASGESESSTATAKAYNAAIPLEVAPATLSEFRILEHRAEEGAELQQYVSDLSLPRNVGHDKPAGQAKEMRMNGLHFRKGLGVSATSRIDLQLQGGWTLLRADLGVDDSCRNAGGLQFQIWSGARLLYDSGFISAPAVVKPEIDVRGLSQLSLRTLGAKGSRPAQVCGNWANAVLTGTEGATARLR
jgi:alpha-glucosidase (family GH31 glycosyl hydrolase)